MTTAYTRPIHRTLLALLFCCTMLQGCVDRSISTAPDRIPAVTGDPTPTPAGSSPDRDIEILLATPVSSITPDDALDARNVGKRVRWAGGMHHTSPSDNGVCLTVLYAASGPYGAPQWMPEPTYQSFEACTDGTYDPELLHQNAEVTIIGRVSGKTSIRMGGGSSEGPVVQIEKLFRWSDCLDSDSSPDCQPGFMTPHAVP